MISVKIEINGQVIFMRSAVNSGETTKTGEHIYRTEHETECIEHHRRDGAVKLAIAILKQAEPSYDRLA